MTSAASLKDARSEEHTSELQSQFHLVCRPPSSPLFPYTTLFRSVGRALRRALSPDLELVFHLALREVGEEARVEERLDAADLVDRAVPVLEDVVELLLDDVGRVFEGREIGRAHV